MFCVCVAFIFCTRYDSGMRPPRPAYTPAPNGTLYTCDTAAVNQSRHPSSKWQTRLQEMLTPSSSRAYAMGCAIITLLLLTVFLIFYFLGKNPHLSPHLSSIYMKLILKLYAPDFGHYCKSL